MLVTGTVPEADPHVAHAVDSHLLHGRTLPRMQATVGLDQRPSRWLGRWLLSFVAPTATLNRVITPEHAGSSLDRVVKCQVFVTNAAYYRIVNEVYGLLSARPAGQDVRRDGW